MNIIFLLFLLVVLFLIIRFIRKLRVNSLKGRIGEIDSEVDKLISSGKTKSERDKLRGLSLTMTKSNGGKISKEDEEWLKRHDIESKKRSKERNDKKLKSLVEKYGSEKGELIHKRKIDLGMTTEMVIDSKGPPNEVIEKVSHGKKREEYFYGRYKNRLGKYSYKFRVVLIDGKVDGWNDITN